MGGIAHLLSARGVILRTRVWGESVGFSMASTVEGEDAHKKLNIGDEKSSLTVENLSEKDIERILMEKIGPPPEKPLPGDCCGSGCNPCVWDIYYDDLQDYNQQKDSLLKSL